VGLQIQALDLGMTEGEIGWIPGALSLSGGSFLLLGGRLADLYGRKMLLSWCLLGFSAWTLIASFATEKYLYFVSRGMQGFFSAGAIPAALGILGAAYPPSQRKNRVFATFSAGNPSGWVVGLIIGGFLTSYSSWRWGFRVIAIVTIIMTACAFIFVPPDPPRDEARLKESVDWLGATFCVCGFLGICYALK
jgi:MFS family permease